MTGTSSGSDNGVKAMCRRIHPADIRPNFRNRYSIASSPALIGTPSRCAKSHRWADCSPRRNACRFSKRPHRRSLAPSPKTTCPSMPPGRWNRHPAHRGRQRRNHPSRSRYRRGRRRILTLCPTPRIQHRPRGSADISTTRRLATTTRQGTEPEHRGPIRRTSVHRNVPGQGRSLRGEALRFPREGSELRRRSDRR
jgi:hypothetical protein